MTEQAASMPETTGTETATQEAAWYLDDNTPGHGPRPDWMPANYKRVSDIAKSHQALEKKLGGFTGAPEKYDIAALELDEEDPTIQTLMDVGKKHNMNQEVFSEMVGRLASIQETTQQMNIEAEVKKLGPGGDKMLVEFKNWVNDYLPAEEREVVTQWVRTADDLKAFNKMMAHTHLSQVPTHQTMQMANNFEGVNELKAELTKNLEKFRNDKTYQKDWQKRMANAVTRNPNG